jgi:hypothetical protein
MILVYTHQLTPRFSYTIDLVFKTVLNVDFKTTTDLTEFENSNLVKIAYTSANQNFDVFIQSSNLLFETGIKPFNIEVDHNSGVYPKFFKASFDDFLGFDLFAMVFYFATRYEEYLDSDLDGHFRHKAENSLAFKNKCLSIPFLNIAIQDFANKLKVLYPNFISQKKVFSYLSTIDIDNAFAFAHKGLKRNVGGFLLDIFKFKFSNLLARISSNINDKKDPFNTFHIIDELSKEYNVKLHYFVLVGDYSTYDKNPHFLNNGFGKLIKSLSNKHNIGLHPSYESYLDVNKIAIEKKRLENITGLKVTSARCHFLRIKFPDTYRAFIDNGITDDYTMIYASETGFRTGLCTPFKWFDLNKNEATSLTIHTSALMEGVLRDYNKLDEESCKKTSLALLEEVRKQNGEFISIFHNDSFSDDNLDLINLYKTILKSV